MMLMRGSLGGPPTRLVLRGALFGVCLLLGVSPTWGQRTIHVNGSTGDDAWDGLCRTWDGGTCGPKATIQAGIDAAVSGDTVHVAAGTYTGDGNRDLDFGGKAITVRGVSGAPATCIIDCQDSGRAFYLHSGEGRAAIVDGFTITNGQLSENNGGGLSCVDSSPTIRNCVFQDTYVIDGFGGCVCSTGGSPLITGCRFDNCGVGSGGEPPYGGGGIYCTGGAPEIVGNVFDNCGFYVYCGGGGGAVAFMDTDISIRNNEISGCGGHGAGGGIWGGSSQVDISRNRIARCNAFHHGGAMVIWSCSGKLSHNIMVDNHVPDMTGGAVDVRDSDIEIAFCTIVDNTVGMGGSVGVGGGIFVRLDSTVLIHHCILWGNSASAEGDQFYFYEPDTVTVRYCDVQGGWPGAENVDADPQFLAHPNPGPDEEWGTEDDDLGDLHLQVASPCVDAGDPGYCSAGQHDIDGQPRLMAITGARVDMGADEVTGAPFSSAGDLNCDCTANAFDIDPFVMALGDPAAYEAAFPNCDIMNADANDDGLINAFDIDPFVVLLSGE